MLKSIFLLVALFSFNAGAAENKSAKIMLISKKQKKTLPELDLSTMKKKLKIKDPSSDPETVALAKQLEAALGEGWAQGEMTESEQDANFRYGMKYIQEARGGGCKFIYPKSMKLGPDPFFEGTGKVVEGISKSNPNFKLQIKDKKTNVAVLDLYLTLKLWAKGEKAFKKLLINDGYYQRAMPIWQSKKNFSIAGLDAYINRGAGGPEYSGLCLHGYLISGECHVYAEMCFSHHHNTQFNEDILRVQSGYFIKVLRSIVELN